MSRYDTAASQAKLYEMKQKTVNAKSAARLLRKKARVFDLMLRDYSKDLIKSTQMMEDIMRSMFIKIAEAKYVTGSFAALAQEIVGKASVKVTSTTDKTLGGAIVFEIVTDEEAEFWPMAGLGTGGHQLSELKKLSQEAIETVVHQTTLRKVITMLVEARISTMRKSMVIMNVTVPKIMRTIKYIGEQLDDMEREDLYRLKQIQRKMLAKSQMEHLKRMQERDDIEEAEFLKGPRKRTLTRQEQRSSSFSSSVFEEWVKKRDSLEASQGLEEEESKKRGSANINDKSIQVLIERGVEEKSTQTDPCVCKASKICPLMTTNVDKSINTCEAVKINKETDIDKKTTEINKDSSSCESQCTSETTRINKETDKNKNTTEINKDSSSCKSQCTSETTRINKETDKNKNTTEINKDSSSCKSQCTSETTKINKEPNNCKNKSSYGRVNENNKPCSCKNKNSYGKLKDNNRPCNCKNKNTHGPIKVSNETSYKSTLGIKSTNQTGPSCSKQQNQKVNNSDGEVQNDKEKSKQCCSKQKSQLCSKNCKCPRASIHVVEKVDTYTEVETQKDQVETQKDQEETQKDQEETIPNCSENKENSSDENNPPK